MTHVALGGGWIWLPCLCAPFATYALFKIAAQLDAIRRTQNTRARLEASRRAGERGSVKERAGV